jgi:hypothetical protein
VVQTLPRIFFDPDVHVVVGHVCKSTLHTIIGWPEFKRGRCVQRRQRTTRSYLCLACMHTYEEDE